MSKSYSEAEVLWEPRPDVGENVRAFQEAICRKYNIKFDNYWSFHKWTVDNFRSFWAEMWQSAKVISSKPYTEVFPDDAGVQDAKKWFPGARLNYAENLLRYRDDKIAIIADGECRETKTYTYSDLYKESCLYGAALRKLGLKIGDVVACYMSNREECVFAMIGTTSIGAVWSGVLPLFGAKAALDRLKEIQPKFLFTIDRFVHDGVEIEMLEKVKEIAAGLPCLQKVIIVPSNPHSLQKDISGIRNSCFLPEYLALGCESDGSVEDLEFAQLPFDHPVFIHSTSGTSGKYKCLVHGFGCLLCMYRDFGIQLDLKRKDVWLAVSPVGWASWTMHTNLLYLGLTQVLFEGVPFFRTPTFMWDLVDKFSISHLFFTPSVVDGFEKKGYLPTSNHHLSSLKLILSAGAIVKPGNFEFAYTKIKPGVIFCSAYGATEVMVVCNTTELTLPIHKGEVNTPGLGLDVRCYNDSGKPVLGEIGEIVVATPFPSLALSLWGDNDGERYRKLYFSRFKGVLVMNDLGVINPNTRGLIVVGRSDETIKQGECRFGSSEIYSVVNAFPEVEDSICVSQRNATQTKSRAVLFLKMQNGCEFTGEFVHRVQNAISGELTEEHVPEVILETKAVPHNLNGKKMESVVRKIINKMAYDSENVINPDSLQSFLNVPELDGY